MYNILSILSGLGAWGFGAASLRRKGELWCCFASFTLCACALLWQLLEVSRRVEPALMDTMDAVVLAASVLVAVTVVLNLPALLRGRRKTDRK